MFIPTDQLTAVDRYYESLSALARYKIALDALRKLSKSITKNEICIVSAVDNTKAGGLHSVDVLVMPDREMVFVRVPSEPHADLDNSGHATVVKGGRNPTILHALEIVIAAYRESTNTRYPELKFCLSEHDIFAIAGIEESKAADLLLVPLTFEPANTSALIFHTQATKINPVELSVAWYRVMQTDATLVSDPFRHTIMVMPVSPSNGKENPHYEKDQPANRRDLFVEVLPAGIVQDRGRFRAMHLSKISRWETHALDGGRYSPHVQAEGRRKIVTLYG